MSKLPVGDPIAWTILLRYYSKWYHGVDVANPSRVAQGKYISNRSEEPYAVVVVGV